MIQKDFSLEVLSCRHCCLESVFLCLFFVLFSFFIFIFWDVDILLRNENKCIYLWICCSNSAPHMKYVVSLVNFTVVSLHNACSINIFPKIFNKKVRFWRVNKGSNRQIASLERGLASPWFALIALKCRRTWLFI